MRRPGPRPTDDDVVPAADAPDPEPVADDPSDDNARELVGFVLVVEDEPSMARALGGYVREYVAVEYATTVAEARLKVRKPGLLAILLDIGLPGESGLALLGELPCRPRRPPVLVVTGDRERANDVQYWGAEFAIKPVPAENVCAFLERAGVMRWAKLRKTLTRPGGPRLTPRDVEIVLLAGLGLRRTAIAQVLDIEVCTVKTHIHKINGLFGAFRLDTLIASLLA